MYTVYMHSPKQHNNTVFIIRSNSHDHLSKYKSLRNAIASKIRTAKQIFFEKLASSTNDSKQFWSIIRTLQPRSPSSCSLSSGSVAVTTDTDKATILNDFFTSCFNQRTVPPSYSINNSTTDRDLDPYDCVSDEVCDRLKRLKTHSATGPDGISSWMLKTIAQEIAPSVTSLFNLSIELGKILTDLKMSNIVPIQRTKFDSSDPSHCCQLQARFLSGTFTLFS